MGADAEDGVIGYEQARRLRATMVAAGIDRGRLWLYYFSIGGEVSEFEVDAYLHHSLLLEQLQRDLGPVPRCSPGAVLRRGLQLPARPGQRGAGRLVWEQVEQPAAHVPVAKEPPSWICN